MGRITQELTLCSIIHYTLFLSNKYALHSQDCFLGGSVVKNPPASAGDTEDLGSVLGSGRSSGGGNRQLTPVLLPGKSHGQRSLVGLRP